jgi:alpha-tubulin suppressor-like RCC1 family protein
MSIVVDYNDEGVASVINNIVTRSVMAFDDATSSTDLYIGASRDVHVQLSGTDALVLKSDASNVEFHGSTGLGLSFQGGDTSNTVFLGDLGIQESNDIQIITSKKSRVDVMNDMCIHGTQIVKGDLLNSGRFITESLNFVRPVDNNSNHIGYGFRVNDQSNLELYKYDDSIKTTKRVLEFGRGSVSGSNDTSTFPIFGDSNIQESLFTEFQRRLAPTLVSSTMDTHLVPKEDGAYDLGSTDSRWRDLYLSGSKVDMNGLILSQSNGQLVVNNAIVPTEDVTYDLGSAERRWRDLYLSGNTIDLGGLKISNNSNETIAVRDGTGALKSIEAKEFKIRGSNNEMFSLNVRNGKFQLVNRSTSNSDTVVDDEDLPFGNIGGESTLNNNASIIPSINGIFDLGSSSKRFKNLYLSGNTISFANGLQLDMHDFSFLSSFILPPRQEQPLDTTFLFRGTATNHSAYIRDGDLYVFGHNHFGQLGLGDLVDRAQPTKVHGITEAKAVACGDSFTVVLLNDGTARAFGRNEHGQLGDGTTQNRTAPVVVAGVQNATAVSCGFNFAVFLLADGSIVGIGSNALGQLGNPTRVSVTNTTLVTMIQPQTPEGQDPATFKPRFVVCAGYHTVVLLENGLAYACGDNSFGQLGIDPATSAKSTSLSLIPNVSDVVSAECGHHHSFLVRLNGDVLGFGRNDQGQLGLGTKSAFVSTPTQVLTQTGVTDAGLSTFVSTGIGHTVVLLANNRIMVFGSNAKGQLGLGANIPEALTPTTLNGYPGYAIACGENHTVIKTFPSALSILGFNSIVLAFGDNEYGQIGDANASIKTRPFPVRIFETSATINNRHLSTHSMNAVGSGYIDPDGVLYVTGPTRVLGEVENIVLTPEAAAFQPVSRLISRCIIVSISNHVLALTDTAEVFSWGRNTNGELGNGVTGTEVRTPQNITTSGSIAENTIIAVATGRGFSMALDIVGRVHTWGGGSAGQLGTGGTLTSSSRPTNISANGSLAEKAIIAISAGGNHAMALDSDGQVHTWGSGANGALGINDTSNSLIPVLVGTFGSLEGKTITTIAAGDGFSMALDSDGVVHTWGRTCIGVDGIGSSLVPVSVEGSGSLQDIQVVAICAGVSTAAALDALGQVHVWGTNTLGQVGNNTTVFASVPTNISGFGSLAAKACIAISSGASHFVAMDSDYSIHVWGNGANGRLGLNSTSNQLVPAKVTKTIRDYHAPILSEGGLGEHKLFRNLPNTPVNTIKVAGRNGTSQLGLPVGKRLVSPRDLPAFPSSVVHTANSASHSAVVLANRDLYVWGLNNVGQCGQAAGTNITTPTLVPNIKAKEVACGSNFTLVVTEDGTVYAFGSNSKGQFGSGTTASSTNSPVLLPHVGVKRVFAGEEAAAFIKDDGTAFIFGSNVFGKLGIDSTASTVLTATLIPTMGNERVVHVAFGFFHTTILLSDGTVFTAGMNSKGQLGQADGFGISSSNRTFRQVAWPYSARAIDVGCGAEHTVVHLSNGRMLTFGDNNNMQTPYNNTSAAWTPFLQPHVFGVVRVSTSRFATHVEYASDPKIGTLATRKPFEESIRISTSATHTIIINSNSQVMTTGNNSFGQRGDGSTSGTSTFTDISQSGSINGKIIVSVGASGNSVNGAFTTFVDADGIAHLCGSTNFGVTNTGTTNLRPIVWHTTQIYIATTCGLHFGALLSADGKVSAFGQNTSGQIGIGTTNSPASAYPITMGSIANAFIVAIACGSNHMLALDNQGRVHAWGANASCQVGDGTTTARLVPVDISTSGSLVGKFIIAIASEGGANHSLALDSDGLVHAWGNNSNGRLGLGANSPGNPVTRPNAVTTLSGQRIVAICAGRSHSMFLNNIGQLFMCGTNAEQVLQMIDTNTPTLVTKGALKDKFITSIYTSALNAFAVTQGREIIGWGQNVSGQLGVGTTTSPISPATILPIDAPLDNTPLFANFTGQHRCFVDNLPLTEQHAHIGLLVSSNRNKYYSLERNDDTVNINDSLPIVALTSKSRDKAVFGVISLVPDDRSSKDPIDIRSLVAMGDVRVQVNAIGEGAVWVCDMGGSLEAGDLITSSEVPGYGMRQDDDVLRNYTVAKITMDCDFSAPLAEQQRIKRDSNGYYEVDEQGMPVWETTLNDESQPVTRSAYEIRYLLPDGKVIDKQTYEDRQVAGEVVFKAALVGCTYHSG